ncbi:MAG: chromosome segregation protein SMC, partial [Pseudomonadota bacterium]|nr:chromosome segregation protein SMC [Pseudomonadota bacterium]
RERAEAAGDLVDIAERWLARAAAAKLAHLAIERHRAAAQDPLIARAGALFRVATAQSFVGLGVGYDENDHPILVARRAEGRTVEVKGLSEGARDQLFLSLRLALLERREGEPLPFVGDDLLASFDDERTRCTLDLLAEFGARRQTILFTHHARVAEIARQLAGRAVEVIEM